MNKHLKTVLSDKRDTIVKRWFEAVARTYPADTARFLQSRRDPFANPVGNTTIRGLNGLFDQLLADMVPDEVVACLDPIIRIRAVQSFTPSRATGFVFALKAIIRDQVGKGGSERPIADGLTEIDGRIDDMGLMAFDVYMRCKEKVYQIKANEMRNRTYSAFHRAGLVREIPEDGPDLSKTIE